MSILILWCIIIFALAILAVGVYYLIYSRNINKKICEGNSSQKKMLDVPHVLGIVLFIICVSYILIVSYDYKHYRINIENQMQNRNNVAMVDLDDYSYSSYAGNVELNDASFLKVYSKEKNEGYKKTVSQDGDFLFTVFTRTSEHDDFHPDFLCYVEYVGEMRNDYKLFENYEYIDEVGNECGGFGSGGVDASKEYLYVGNVNEGQSVKIMLGMLGNEASQKFAIAEEETMQRDSECLPNYSEYADEYGSIVIEVN